MVNLWKLLSTAKKQAQLSEFDYQMLFHTGYQSRENIMRLHSEFEMFFKQIETQYNTLNPDLIKSVVQKICKQALLASTSGF